MCGDAEGVYEYDLSAHHTEAAETHGFARPVHPLEQVFQHLFKHMGEVAGAGDGVDGKDRDLGSTISLGFIQVDRHP